MLSVTRLRYREDPLGNDLYSHKLIVCGP